MPKVEGIFYEFGRFRLSTADRVLLRQGELVPLTPKVFDILLALVENGGKLVEKDDLMKRVWPHTFVEEGNLTQNISLLRKALGDGIAGQQFIETIPRRGYRFVSPVAGSQDETGLSTATIALPSAQEDTGNGQTTKSDSIPEPEVNGGLNRIIDSKLTTVLPFSRFGSAGRKSLLLGTAFFALLITVGGFGYFTRRGNAEPTPIQSIAVLPFVNEASDSDAAYLNDKIAESLINSLSKLPKLRVVPRSVVASYTGKEIDPRKIGQDLSVRAVVTGRVRRHGDTISIQADLIDIENVAQLWGQHYDRKLSDILLVQEDISRDIFENLRLKLNVEEKKQLEAYRLYLKGRNSWNKRTEEALQKGIEFFQQAIDIDSGYAPAYAGMADCHNMLVVYGISRPKDGFPKAKEAALKALEADETLAEAHASLAFIAFRWDRNRVEAEREFQRAIMLKPSYASAHQWYSSHLAALERFDEAIAEAKRTEDLEPLSSTASSHLGWILYLSGKNDEAIKQCTKILDLDPNSFPARRYRGLAYEQKGMYREAIEDFQKGVQISGSPLMLALLGHAYAASGNKSEAQKVLKELDDLQNQRYISPYTVAAIHAAMNEKDRAFEWLEKAYEERDIWMMNLKVDPVFSKLRSDRRFQDLLTRAGLKP